VSEAISLFAFNSKNLQATHTRKCVTLPNFFCGCPYEKRFKKLVLPLFIALLGKTVQNIFLL